MEITPDMANGRGTDAELWEAVKALADGKKMSRAARDRFLFGAIGDLRGRIGAVEARLGHIWPVYQALALLWIPVVGGLIMLFVTGKLVISRGP